MKNAIENWLVYDRKFNTGVILYHKFGKNKALKNKFNLQGKNKSNEEALLEEFRLMIGKSVQEFNKILITPVKPIIKKAEVIVSEEIIPELKKVEKPERQKLRDEFPFLSDPRCPNELKILISDKLTAYHAYVEAHGHLFTAETSQEQFEAARNTVENWLENQAIYKELDFFKKHAEILGEHKLFEKMAIIEGFNKLSTEGLCKIRDNKNHSIWRNEKLIEEGKKPDLNKSRQDKIQQYKWELEQIELIIQNRK